jgi:hypothetical protein
MEPSEAMPGVILYGYECDIVRQSLQTYPESGSFGQDPHIRHALEQMQRAQAVRGNLKSYLLSADVAEKLSSYIEEQAAEWSLNDMAAVFVGMAGGVPAPQLFERARKKTQQKFAEQLRKTCFMSRLVAHEQIT